MTGTQSPVGIPMRNPLLRHAPFLQRHSLARILEMITWTARLGKDFTRRNKRLKFVFQNSTSSRAVFCEFVNNVNETVKLFVKNVTDPVGEFWERKALDQTGGVGGFVLFCCELKG